MTSQMAAIGIAVGGTFLVCLLLFKQAQKRSGSRRWSSGDSGFDGGYLSLGDTSGHHSHSLSHSFGHGGDHSGSGDSGSPGDSGGGGDGGEGGDGGGGDGGGGGGD